MIIFTHRNFDRKYKKLRENQKQLFKERKKLFLIDKFNSILNNHALRGKYEGFRSINIGGDLRAIYKEISTDKVVFADIGNRNNLYK